MNRERLMKRFSWPMAFAALVVVALAGCGTTHYAAPPVSGRLVGVAGSQSGQIQLSALGAQRIGLQLAPAGRVAPPKPRHHGKGAPAPSSSGNVTVPFSAIVYAPDGDTFAFARTGPLTYEEMPIVVDHISGDSAYLKKGPKPGTEIVSVGAEELYGVQTGVLAQT